MSKWQDNVRAQQQKPYAVNVWGSEPGTNDDCWSGTDHDTFEEALVAYNAALDDPKNPDYCWVELDGPDFHADRQKVLGAKRPADRDDDWKRERAMQAGMGLGCEAYNDEMGW